MPRGRIGLWLIGPEKIREAIAHSPQSLVAEGFHVTTRTIRRWCKVGMSPGYAGVNPSREQWEVFAATSWKKCGTYGVRSEWHAYSIAHGKAPSNHDWNKPAKKAKAKGKARRA